MQADTATVSATSDRDTPAIRRMNPAGTRPFPRVDRRTRQSRRAERLVAELTAAMGSPVSVVQASLIRKVAELTVAAEALRARILAGETALAAFEQLTKIEGEARRTLRALGVETKPQPKRGPTLGDLLREDAETGDG